MTISEIENAARETDGPATPDPVYARAEYPLETRLYPLGFPVDMVSNSEEAIEIAEQAWGRFEALFDTKPIRVRVSVLPGSAAHDPPAPSCRLQEHILSFVADHQNFGIADFKSGFSSIWLTHAAIKSHRYCRHFFLDCAVFSQISNRYATGVHAACVERKGIGVLLCGESGAGKSTLAYACAKAGWTYVTDDGSYLAHGSHTLTVTGNCRQFRFRPSSTALFPEIAGHPVTQRCDASKPSIEIATDSWSGVQFSQTAKIRFLVFLNRREGTNMRLRPYAKAAAGAFLRHGRFSPPDIMQRHEEVIGGLLRLEVLELIYQDLDFALEQLNTLAGAGER